MLASFAPILLYFGQPYLQILDEGGNQVWEGDNVENSHQPRVLYWREQTAKEKGEKSNKYAPRMKICTQPNKIAMIVFFPSLKVDEEKQLHDGRDVGNPADDKDRDLELLDGDEHRPKWKGAPNLGH